MLSDRSYMRDGYGRSTTPLLTWMMCALIAGYLLQIVFDKAINSGNYFAKLTALSGASLQAGWVWTLVTHTLLHSNPVFILLNLLGIYFLGRELLPLLGERRLLWLYIGAAVLGGALWLTLHFDGGTKLMGASAVVCAFLLLFALLNPEREMTFLFFFVPVTIKPKHMAWAMVIFDTLGLVANEIPGGRFNLGIAHSSHIGGMVAALMYFRFVHLREWRSPDGRTEIELPKWLRKAPKVPDARATAAPKYSVNITDRANLRTEVDRILDKINSEGLASLTPDEKRLLDDAKDAISRR